MAYLSTYKDEFRSGMFTSETIVSTPVLPSMSQPTTAPSDVCVQVTAAVGFKSAGKASDSAKVR